MSDVVEPLLAGCSQNSKATRLSRRETSFSGRGDFTDAFPKREERSPKGRPTSIRTLAGHYSQETQKPVTAIPLDVRHVNPIILFGVTKIEQTGLRGGKRPAFTLSGAAYLLGRPESKFTVEATEELYGTCACLP
jgi:hypothetical protein